MTITIHQAICGEQNKGWELLQTTLEEKAIAKKIAFQTDLQDSPPSGLQWIPVIRGFLFGDYFLIIKTYPDNSPNVRNGRVFSHCLIINKRDLGIISDISPLVSAFKIEIDKTIQLKPIILTLESQETVNLDNSLQLRFNKIIQSFIKFTSDQNPIIWIGQEHFEIAVCKLWQLLSAVQRENFHFGINFNAGEVAKDMLSFVVIPDNAESKFQNNNFIIIRKEDAVQLKDFSEQFLAGELNATIKIEKFISAIGATKPELQDITIIAKGVPTFENIEKERDLKLLNTLSNIVAKFSTDENKGIAFKTKLVERISLLAKTADESDIFLLRNFQIKSFKGSEKKIAQSINEWVSDFLLNEKQNQKVNYVPFIIKVAEAPQTNWLVKLISKNISNFLFNINTTSAKIIWQWIINDIDIIKIISKEIENTKNAEFFLYDVLPKASDKVLSKVKDFSLTRKWFRLYAKIVKSQFNFEIAVEEQLKVDLDRNNFEGIDIITEGVKSNEIINVTIINGDKRLIHLSGRLCRTNTKLLAEIRIENTYWQEIWLEAIRNGNNIFDGIKEPQKVVYLFFDLMVIGKSVNVGLLEKISGTDFANILNYPSRNKLWSRLPSNLKGKFLEKTSSTLLQTLSNNSTYQVPTDTELSKYIISNAISVFLYYNKSNIKNVLPIFSTYSQTPEHIIRDYISNYFGKMDFIDATQLGQIVYFRNYISIAEVILQKSYTSKSFKHALNECYRILNLFHRLTAISLLQLSDTSISEDEWWSAFIQLAYTLYDEGPGQNRIWTQADGKGYDLETKGSGKEVWIAALQRLRAEKCAGDITIKKLLKAMIEENKKNDGLKALKKLRNKI